ncbi:MAG TPA: hypothetical protein VGR18_11185 [Rubrobacter sp.]|nr:hypothetical protein [Rubrobacter sp.]
MGKRKSVPDDLMETILSESFDAADEKQALSESRGSPGAVSWDEKAERVGIAFNLSKQLSVELEKLRWDLRLGEDVRPSKSEIAEVALRIAVEDVRERSTESELYRRLDERRVAQFSNAVAGPTQRSVDESGWIFETTHDENGAIVDEEVVGTVADLPVIDEYVDEQGRLVSVAKDELGNTFERIVDEGFNTVGARLLQNGDREVR